MKFNACGVSRRYEYATPLHWPLVTNELSARMMFVPPSRSGPPESPKHVPPLLTWYLMNSSLIELLLAISVDGAKNLVNAAPGTGLQGPPQGPPPLMKFWTPKPTKSTGVPIGSVSTSPCVGSAPYLPLVALDGIGPQLFVPERFGGTAQPSVVKITTATSCVSKPGRPPPVPSPNCGSK